MRLIVPTAAVGAALYAAGHGWGLFRLLELRLSVAALLGFLVLDFVIFAQHWVFHHVPLLWRLHRMHHADLDIDVTTGLRFHPFEILISLAVKIATMIAFGIPPVAVLLFEVVLNATSMFNHSNVRLPVSVDRVAAAGPRDARHAPRPPFGRSADEHNSNFGFNLPWWDRLFRTYRAQPRDGHSGMTIGLPMFRDPGELRLDRLLTQPFRDDRADHPGPFRRGVGRMHRRRMRTKPTVAIV